MELNVTMAIGISHSVEIRVLDNELRVFVNGYLGHKATVRLNPTQRAENAAAVADPTDVYASPPWFVSAGGLADLRYVSYTNIEKCHP